MSILERNCEWHFEKQPQAAQDIGPNNAAEAYFADTPYPSLIRESIQNSLDVVKDKSQPVKMKFEFGKLRTKSFDNFYKLREHIWGAYKLYGKKADQYKTMLERFDMTYNNQNVIYYIKVSDFNTTGMDYKPDDSPFYAFLRALGYNVKTDDAAGGSYGFGHSAFFVMSPIHTILVSTMTDAGKTYFEGAANLCTHLYKGKDGVETKYMHYGYYDNQDGQKPASLQTDIPDRFYRNEPGTDIYVMGVDGEASKVDAAYKEMIKATLRHFWLAIYNNKLIVEIGNTVIDTDSLEELMSQNYPEILDKARSHDDYNPRPYYEAVKNAGTSNQFIKIDKKLSILGDTNLYIWKNKEARDGIVHMRNKCMYIFRARHYSSSYGYFGVLYFKDDKGGALLKDLEDPAHKKWEFSKLGDKGYLIREEINNFVSESLQSIFVTNGDGALGIAGTDEYLFVPEDLLTPDAEKLKDNPLFGTPDDDQQEEGNSPTTDIIDSAPTYIETKEKKGKVVILKPSKGKPKGGGSMGGHIRSTKKKKKKGKGTAPGGGGYEPDDTATVGEFLHNVPVDYRVMAEHKSGKMIHTISMKVENDVVNGQIEIIVGGEERDETVGIISASQGTINGNTISDLVLSKDKRNIIELQFEDNMKHIVKLTAYEFK